MSRKCQFCREGSVIEDETNDGRKELICVECGSVATSKVSDYHQTADKTGISLFDHQSEEKTSVTFPNICQSCGEVLLHNETSFCSECNDLEETEVKQSHLALSEEYTAADAIEVCVKSGSADCKSSKIPSCPSCKSTDLEVDSLGTEERLFCKRCGNVMGGDAFTNDGPSESSTRTFGNMLQTVPVFATRRRQDCEGLTVGIHRIDILYQKLVLPLHVKEEAEVLFKKAFYKPQVKCRPIFTKVHMAAMCLFFACRRNNIPICLIHFKKHVDNMELFIKSFTYLRKLLDIKLPTPSLAKQIDSVILSLDFQKNGFDPSSMVSKVRDLVFLSRRAWITSGSLYQSIIFRALYYLYVGSNSKRSHISYNLFCTHFKLPNTAARNGTQFTEFMLKLAKALPWVNADKIKHRTLHFYIEDIIRYKNSLIHLAFEIPAAGMECHRWESGASSAGSEPCVAAEKSKVASDQKCLLLPLSFKRSRTEVNVPHTEIVIPTHLDLDATEIKETDFPEDEISSYILTQEERDDLKNAKMGIIMSKKQRLK